MLQLLPGDGVREREEGREGTEREGGVAAKTLGKSENEIT